LSFIIFSERGLDEQGCGCCHQGAVQASSSPSQGPVTAAKIHE
jgi:hypothetical protein